jgi:glycosyltransferase involved in cell wall biosynthesis
MCYSRLAFKGANVPEFSRSVSVIIAFRNALKYLPACLDAVAAACGPEDELVLIDDGSADESAEIARQFTDNLVRLEHSHGPAFARNRGAEKAAGRILFFIDADVLCHPDTLARIRGIFADDPRLAAVIGSYDADPPAPNFISRYKNLTHHFVHQSGAAEASTFWTGCGAIRKEIFSQLGGFDESYGRPSIEDIELGYRLRAQGFRIALRRDLLVTHAKKWTLTSLLRSDILDRAIPWTKLQLSYGRLLNDLNISRVQRASSFFTCASLLLCLCGIFVPILFALAGALMFPVVFWNRKLYHFYLHQGGVAFAMGSIAMHWLYYCYSLAAFAVGAAAYFSSARRTVCFKTGMEQ